MAYSEEQRETARALQDVYLARVAKAWEIEREAAKERVRRVKSAEADRNAALKAAGIKVNDLRDMYS